MIHSKPELAALVTAVEPIDQLGPNDLYLMRVTDRSDAVAMALRSVHGVESVEPNVAFRTNWSPPLSPPTACTPSPTLSWNLEALNAAQAWRLLGWPPCSLEHFAVGVAVMDTGVADVDDLKSRIGDGANCVGQDCTTCVEQHCQTVVNDEQGHGTAMASIVAALGANGVGIDGLMWGAKIHACKMAVGENACLDAMIRCLQWVSDLAEKGAQIAAVNFSFALSCCSPEMARQILGLRQQGILLVAAAGDGGADNDLVGNGNCPNFPASLPLSNILSVTGHSRSGFAINDTGKRTVHVAAPGDNIPVLKTDGCPRYDFQNTSPAAAHVTGLVALLKAQDQRRDWRALRNLVLAGGVFLKGPGKDTTITGRRIRAADQCPPTPTPCTGSLTCVNQRVRRRLYPIAPHSPLALGDNLRLKALSIKCEHSETPGPIKIQLLTPTPTPTGSGGSTATPPPTCDPTIPLPQWKDDGTEPDDYPGDGEWAAYWSPPCPGTYELNFWNVDSDEVDDRDTLRVIVK